MDRTIGTRVCALLALVSLCCTVKAQTTEPTPSPDPWDAPPLMCLSPAGPKLRVCQLGLGSGDPSTWLRSYGLAGDFASLERALRKLAESKDFFPERRLKGSAVFRILDEFADAHRTAGMTPKGQVLANWKKAFPESEFVLLADAMVLCGEAWDVRGSGYASTVSPAAWEIFGQKMRAAEKMLVGAPPRLKETAAWNSLLLRIAFQGRGVESKWPDVFMAAVERWPTYIGFYETAVWQLSPRWGGSWEAVEAFIDESSRRVASSEGMSFYARLYSHFGNGVVERQPPLDWAKLRPAFDDWIERDPTAFARNRYASFACFARDKVTFRKIMEQTPKEEIYAAPWLTGYSYESCALWASR